MELEGLELEELSVDDDYGVRIQGGTYSLMLQGRKEVSYMSGTGASPRMI
jgi:hypothetical protein